MARIEPPVVNQEPSLNMAKVLPRMPGPEDTTQYWVQVGAYKNRTYAQEAFNRAAGAGFSPTFATSEGLVRVLIPWVRGNEMQEIAARLYNAGFREILLRTNFKADKM
jgi:cell division protein FtsN